MFKNITSTMLAGALAILPIYLTAFLLYWMFTTLDAFLQPLVIRVAHVPIWGLGFLLTLGIVYFVGLFVSNIYGAVLMGWVNQILEKLPVFKGLYVNIKRIIDSLNPKNPSGFKEFVFVKTPGNAGYTAGFLTSHFTLKKPDGSRERLASVYIPSNHLYLGAIHVVEESRIVRVPISLQDGAAFSLSAGASLTGELEEEKPPGYPSSPGGDTPPTGPS